MTNEAFGAACVFEADEAPFPQVGYTIGVLQPGAAERHVPPRESDQEDFLVLSGECVLVIEGEERPLKAWDFVHCPPGTDHIFVGAGDGPCVIFMAGARSDGNVDRRTRETRSRSATAPASRPRRRNRARPTRRSRNGRTARPRAGTARRGTTPVIRLAAAVTAVLAIAATSALAAGTAHRAVDPKAIPLGDGRVSSAPKVGYVDVCQTSFGGIGGAQAVGPWIDEAAGTWDRTKKLSVQGAVKWPQARYTTKVAGTKRTFSFNDLPVGHSTGSFPIASATRPQRTTATRTRSPRRPWPGACR